MAIRRACMALAGLVVNLAGDSSEHVVDTDGVPVEKAATGAGFYGA